MKQSGFENAFASL